MSNKTSRWLVGCGIGCGLVALVVIVLWVGGCLFVKRTFRGIEQAIESHQELVDRFGEIDGFVPPADGAVAPQRLERFLAVRESLGDHQAAVDAILAEIPGLGFVSASQGLTPLATLCRPSRAWVSVHGRSGASMKKLRLQFWDGENHKKVF